MDSARRKQSAAMAAAKEAARVEAIDLANRQLEAYAEFSRYANGLSDRQLMPPPPELYIDYNKSTDLHTHIMPGVRGPTHVGDE